MCFVLKQNHCCTAVVTVVAAGYFLAPVFAGFPLTGLRFAGICQKTVIRRRRDSVRISDSNSCEQERGIVRSPSAATVPPLVLQIETLDQNHLMHSNNCRSLLISKLPKHH